MEPYQDAPSLIQLSIPERTDALRRTCLSLLQNGRITLADLVSATEEGLVNEQYELVEGVKQAAQEFRANPQRSLF